MVSMCGFAGYRLFHEHAVDDEIAKQLSQTLYHRGPDDEGLWYSDDRKILLVARRLSIVDISSAGAQPMIDAQGQVVLAFNGEIYNYRELRAELEQQGCQFRSQSDTEVLLYAYKTWGITCLQRLDGMFAAAIYDKQSGDLYLVRDRIGIKPLYFSTQGDCISFASEIKALWQLPWMVKRIALHAVSHYLTFLATPAPMTLFETVYKLPAGFYARVNHEHEITFTQWYDPVTSMRNASYSQEPLKRSQYVDRVRALLREAVRKRMIADVPVGALLSGGLDSSLVTALMKETGADVKTFTVAFEHDLHEERAWARKAARQLGTDHHELIIGEKEAFSFFERMAYHQDEPLGDVVCIPLYFVSELARDTGVKVLQVGEGADELFCGYPMYVDYLKLHRSWSFSQRFIPAFARRGLFHAARSFYTTSLNRQDLVRSWASGRPLFWGGVRLFSELWKEKLLVTTDHYADPIVEKIYPLFPQTGDSYAVADYHRSQFYQQWPDGDFFAAMTYIELKHRLPELLLTRTDKMSMAASVEARVPFLDYRMVEYALQIPMQFKYYRGETKYILKKAAEGIIPHEIMKRKKVGFSVPVAHWFKEGIYFRTHLADMFHSKTIWQDLFKPDEMYRLLNATEHGSVDYVYQLWALQNIMAF